MIELKGHHRVTHALAGIRRQGLDADLIIAGRGGAYEGEIKKSIAQCGLDGHVRILGELPPDDLAEVMSASDVVCLASSREGWPNVVHEAMACGTPVVATDVGAVRQMVPSSEHGLVVPPLNEQALEGALLQALQRDRDRSRISTWAQARGWQQVASEVALEFQTAVSERST